MNRRQLLATLGTGTLTLAGCTGTATDPDATPTPPPDEPLEPVAGTWSTYQYDAARTGYNPVSGTSPGERSGHWISNLMGTEGYEQFAVADGSVYFGDTDGAVHAVQATTGAEQWSAQLLDRTDNEARWRTITVSDGTLFAGNHLRVHALDVETRERRWTVEYDQEAHGGETVILEDVLVAETSPTTVAGVDVASGEIIWEFDTGDEGVGTNLASDGGLVYFMTSRLTVYALDGRSGDLAWEAVAEEIDRSFDLAVADGRVIITSGVVVALDADTGEHVWTVRPHEQVDYRTAQPSLLPIGRAAASGGPLASAPALAHGLVYLKTGDSRAAVALDAENGELAWSVETDKWFTPPVVAGDVAYVATGNVIRAYDASTGEPTGWEFKAIAGIESFVVVDGVVFATGGRGFLQALTGEQA